MPRPCSGDLRSRVLRVRETADADTAIIMDNLSVHKAAAAMCELLDGAGFAYRYLPPLDSAAVEGPR